MALRQGLNGPPQDFLRCNGRHGCENQPLIPFIRAETDELT
jgi:hypothetical protein